MENRNIVFVTGGNTGIGFETVKALLSSPKRYHIFLGSRTPSKGEDAVAELKRMVPATESTVEMVQIDVQDDASIDAAVALVGGKCNRVDTLINNAGAAFDTSFENDVPQFRAILSKAYDVNVSGAQVTTAAFAPLLIASSSPRLVFVTSGLSTLSGNAASFMPPWAPRPVAGWPKKDLFVPQGYQACKAALNMIMLTWHWILREDGVKTFCVSPGFLATNLGGDPERLKAAGAGDPAIGGELLRRVVEGERDDDAGKVVCQQGTQPW
ncbi:hypothetical protein RJ55_04352 [Drechmeria coniospora]|nr:hypothetical protein RJ55_04352 [Drechmeria coniospora]